MNGNIKQPNTGLGITRYIPKIKNTKCQNDPTQNPKHKGQEKNLCFGRIASKILP